MSCGSGGTFPVDTYPVTFHHLPVVDVTWDADAPGADPADPSAFLFHQYQSLLAYGEPLFAKAFHLLGLPGALPAVFHCAAGKDRTGILAALVLASLGVPHDVVARGLRPVPERHGAHPGVGGGRTAPSWRRHGTTCRPTTSAAEPRVDGAACSRC